MPKSKQQVKIMTRVSDLPTLTSRKIKETESSSHGREKYISDTSLVGNPYDDQSRREKLSKLSKDNLDWKVTSKSITKIYVPVISFTGIPLMPCSPRRAKELMKKHKAKKQWRYGIFYIKLLERDIGNIQDISCGIDSGSKREAITVKSKNKTFINILSDARTGVKESLETRRNMRGARRSRKTPCRKNKYNRKRNKNFIPPSTRARWNSKLRLVNILRKIYPITIYVVEDIKAKSKEGQRNWNKNFSPLEVGKKYFYNIIKTYGNLILKEGWETSDKRKELNLEKTKNKLDKVFSAHNIDSWVLANFPFDIQTYPENINIYYFEQIELHRRQLHMLQFAKGGKRRRYGGTVSLGIPKGTVVKVKYKKKAILCYIGGNMNGKLSIHNIENGEIISKIINKEDIKYMGYIAKWKVEKIKGKNKEITSNSSLSA
jgi:hypothetical protein